MGYEIFGIVGVIIGVAGSIAIFFVNFRNTEVKQTISNLEKLANSQKRRLDELSVNYEEATGKIKKLETTVAEIKDIPLKRLATDYQAIARTFSRIESHMQTTNQILKLIQESTPHTVVNVDSSTQKK